MNLPIPYDLTTLAQYCTTNGYTPIGARHLVFEFPNGWGVSIIRGYGTYGLEMAVTRNGKIHYENPVACGDVCGYLSADELLSKMVTVMNFPEDVDVVEGYYFMLANEPNENEDTEEPDELQ